MLRVRDLHVTYGSIAALRGVSVGVEEGQIVAVIGPNGAGKSTLLNAVSGMVGARQGTVEFAGTPLLGQAMETIVSRGICLVPEGRRIFGTLTVAENLQLGGTSDDARLRVGQSRGDNQVQVVLVVGERSHQTTGLA